jgi:hypothetical protein
MPMPSEIVEAVKESQWMKDGVEATTYWVTLVDGVGQREVPCYDPRGKDLKEDAPLHEGWDVKTSKAGKLYLAAPRQSSGGGLTGSGRPGSPATTAWRNTEAGAKYEDERVDRRRALEQAVAANPDSVLGLAETFYAWLRESVSAGTGAVGLIADGKAGSGDANTRPADTPSDEGGGQLNSPTHREAAPPSSSKRAPNQPPPGWDQ